MIKAFTHLSLYSLLYTFFIFSSNLSAQEVHLDYYLPQNVSYDPDIPTPRQVLGFNVGEWHLTHDQLYFYMKTLAEASERITMTEYARSYERRPLVVLTVTSPENHQNIEEIKAQHQQLCDPSQSSGLSTQTMPLVVNLGYSVHGNEASGSNASALVAYYLAAAQGDFVTQLLDQSVILIDPSFNPDGFHRFAAWVNMHKSKTQTTDPHIRELNEIFPRGRTNHYWFDLNRDWLLVQHPESQGRVRKFHEWKPNILTDHHEMGSNSTFFFQPGVPSRTNPLTPARNQELTGKIGDYHAQALDSISSLYYTKESYDDFYYGKGSTYPDINGSIGILFEQASARGYARETVNGILRFPFAVKNQFNVSLSTLRAALDMREELLNYQREFYLKAKGGGAYVFGSEFDLARNYHFFKILENHQISVRELTSDLQTGGETFKAGKAFVVPLNQPQSQLIEALFQQTTEFTDSLFYDVSAWTLPLAFGIPFAQTANVPASEEIDSLAFPQGMLKGGDSKVAYAFAWDSYYAPRALHHLLSKGVRAKVASDKTEIKIEGEVVELDYGAIVVPVGGQALTPEQLYEMMQNLAKENAITVYGLSTGLSDVGIDIGSNYFRPLETPKILLLAGGGTRSYEVGEVWHLLDQRYEIPISLVDKDDFSRVDLNRYNVIVMVSGNYSDLGNNGIEKIKEWLRQGNTIIGVGSANNWMKGAGLIDIQFKPNPVVDTIQGYSYAQRENLRGAQEVGGAIFEAKLDPSHPLAYGYKKTTLPLFKNSNRFVELGNNLFTVPLHYGENPLLSGYISEENLEQLKNSAAVLVNHYGRGQIISFIDNPNFRAFWYGTNKLFANAIFFGDTIGR